jgi:hypothetical protein
MATMSNVIHNTSFIFRNHPLFTWKNLQLLILNESGRNDKLGSGRKITYFVWNIEFNIMVTIAFSYVMMALAGRLPENNAFRKGTPSVYSC